MDANQISIQINVPIAQPGFDALGLSAPVIAQSNPQGNWQSTPPTNLDEERMKAVIQYLVNSNKIAVDQSYCCQCALENQNVGMNSCYVPVIMMPIYPPGECPFDLDAQAQTLTEPNSTKKEGKKKTKEPNTSGQNKGKTNKR